MMRQHWMRTACAGLGVLAMIANGVTPRAAFAQTAPLTLQQKIALLQGKVKYVFVIFQENESFDHFFGTFPGANGLFSAPAGMIPANQTPSFSQRYLDTNLQPQTIQPFLVPQAVQATNGATVPIYPADLVSVDHGHQGMANDLHVINGINANDRYAMNQEGLTTDASGNIVKSSGAAPTAVTLAQKQQGEMVMSHLDCDTIPFLWSFAQNFALFDNFHQTIIGPSTPNAIAVIAGQSGETQWALHPNQGATVTYANPSFQNVKGATYGSNVAGNSNAYVPIVADPGPFPGSQKDPSAVKPPYNFDENAANPAPNLTFATQPLSFMGSSIGNVIRYDQNPRADLLDVQHDIYTIASKNQVVNWGWFQQGFNGNDAPDPFEPQNTGTPNPSNISSLYTGYVLHHNAPQYFGYLADNTQVLSQNLHGAADFITAVNNRSLPGNGGVFYYRGGYSNNQNLMPLDPTQGIKQAFLGNDDHPAYSDHQISEAFVAEAVAAIANSPYWSQSAIIVTYDETDGFYDHEKVNQRSSFVDGSILAGGPRIPTLLISPWALQGSISHQYSEHGSMIKLINELFNLTPLAQLPDEANGRQLGQQRLGQANLGPSDDPANELGDMTEAFDFGRIQANNPIPASTATFNAAQIHGLPHLAGSASPNGYTNGACRTLGILPTDFLTQSDYDSGNPVDKYPQDVNPRPTQSPGTPTSGTWTP